MRRREGKGERRACHTHVKYIYFGKGYLFIFPFLWSCICCFVYLVRFLTNYFLLFPDDFPVMPTIHFFFFKFFPFWFNVKKNGILLKLTEQFQESFGLYIKQPSTSGTQIQSCNTMQRDLREVLLHQTKKLLYKGNHQENEKAIYWMGINICKSYIW